MKTNAAGIALLKQWEGCRLETYRDVVGVLTCCYGHTAAAGDPKPLLGMKFTKQQCEEILISDLARYEVAVVKALKQVPTDNQFSAMTSLCYNIGENAFAASTVVRHFNMGETAKAANAFLMWRKAGGKEVQGLLNRRQAEMALFLKPSAAVAGKTPHHAAEPPILDFEPVPTTGRPNGGGFGAIVAEFIRFILSMFKKGT